ncbi:MAG: hypothetical protein AAFV43_09155 [Planctomycetota bacterium]
MYRVTILTVVVLLLAATAAPARERPIVDGEAIVRSQPMMERPNRVGHFYGNTARRLHHGRLCVNCGVYQRPLARFLYTP